MPAEHFAEKASIASISTFLNEGNSPVAAGKVLGSYLRHLRRERGLAIKQVAPRIRASISKISRLERGESPARDDDVFDLLRFYGVREQAELDEIRLLLEQSRAAAWWHQYSDITPGWLSRLIGLENSATQIRTYEVHHVPGLLQTPDYARAIVSAGLPDASEEEVERRVRLRLARQELLARTNAPKIVALLDEGILRRPVGSREIMREQLSYLRELAVPERSNIHIRVVPFASWPATAPSSPVTLLSFRPGGPSAMVYLEHVDGALYLSKPAEVETYRAVLTGVEGAAAKRRESLALLKDAIKTFS